jgi:hypothetical protein
MEKHHKALVTEAMRNLQWDLIAEVYEGVEYKIKGLKNRNRSKTKEVVKKELFSVLEYMLESQLETLELDHWIIRWTTLFVGQRRNWTKLELIFIPFRSVVREDELMQIDEEDEDVVPAQTLDEEERRALEKVLRKAEKEENYELCLAIYNRLKKLDKIIKKKDDAKKHKESREVRA